MLKEAFGDNALEQTQNYEWFKGFKNGRISVDDEERSGRPSTGTRPKMWQKFDFKSSFIRNFFHQADSEWKILLRISEANEIKTSSANLRTIGATTAGP